MRIAARDVLWSLFLLAAVMQAGVSSGLAATTYEVGPGQAYTAIGDVPWESLQPGDVVRIHWRSTPYREKFVIGRAGTAQAPIVVQGVPGPNGELPVLDGNGATTRLALDFTSETRGVIKIGASTIPPDTLPKYIVIERLIIQGARSSYSFTDDSGATQTYQDNASTIYVEKGENITIRDCELRDAGNGFFVASSDALASRDILVERSYIHDNGNAGSIFEHNIYVAGIGMTFQYNRLGPMAAGAGGNNLKDRSAGLVVRYNWLEGGNRQLDLVNGEDSVLIRNDPRYRVTHVYGNLFIEPDAAGNRQMVNYGGDTGSANGWRKGILYLHANTFVSRRTDRTTLVRLDSNDERCDARNNIVWMEAAAGSSLSLLDTDGVLDWSHNWTEPGWVVSFGNFHGTLNDDGTNLTGSTPGFVDAAGEDYHLDAASACRDAGGPLAAALIPDHVPVREYFKHQAGTDRANDAVVDIGAYEFNLDLGSVTGLLHDADLTTLRWDGLAGACSYDVARGDVASLRSVGLAASVQACVENDGADTETVDATLPGLGQCFWYLVRPISCSGAAGTWGDQGTDRAEIDGGIACP